MATKTILIVDDAAETRIFLKGVINSLGYAFYEAKSGLDALKILNDHMIDLVILDVLMPNLDGYQTLEFINKLKQKQEIKVVFLTGKKGELDQAKIDELNPDDLIHKTVDIQVLKTKLKKLLDGSIPPTKPKVGSVIPTPTPAPAQVNTTATQTPKAAAPTAAKPATPSSTTGTAVKTPPAATQSGEPSLDIAAKITNMPIDVEIVITKISQTTVTFSAKFQFKEGSQLTIDSPKAASTLKKNGAFNVKVLKCSPESDKFIINSQLI
ncbi:response regulator [Pigmentibacter sp. JX0631]|uniref:response regulator n=1 Tax=Pigmentibacter sp. JX0631 TaxID=2976982 RepID=UPI002468770F|nr:response regulator [Pigmentibacter sp. JX0631]WGL60569.1 response regulator [Pigmentibacter sp. JX0631]